MDIVHLFELSRDLRSKAGRKRVGNLLQNIGGGGNSYYTISNPLLIRGYISLTGHEDTRKNQLA